MDVTFTPMTEEQAIIVTSWQYDPPYDFYNSRGDGDALLEMVDPANPYYAASDRSGDLIGFVAFKEAARVPEGYGAGAYDDAEALDIGLGMRPDLTGRGLGLQVVLAALEFARALRNPASFRLSVAAFNARAIRVYERAGFTRTVAFMQHLGGTTHEFVTMVRPA